MMAIGASFIGRRPLDYNAKNGRYAQEGKKDDLVIIGSDTGMTGNVNSNVYLSRDIFPSSPKSRGTSSV